MKDQKTYEILLHVGSLNLATVLDVVKDSATVVGVKQLVPTKPAAHRTTTRIKGISTASIVLGVLSDGQVHTDEELGQALATAGFSATSAHPAASTLVADGKIKRIARGRYCLATVTHLNTGGKA